MNKDLHEWLDSSYENMFSRYMSDFYLTRPGAKNDPEGIEHILEQQISEYLDNIMGESK